MKFDAEKFAATIKAKRGADTLREAAKQIGVCAATVYKLEQGKEMDIQTFIKLCAWLEKQPSEFFKTDEK